MAARSAVAAGIGGDAANPGRFFCPMWRLMRKTSSRSNTRQSRVGNSRTAAFAAVRLPRGQRTARRDGAVSMALPRLVNQTDKKSPHCRGGRMLDRADKSLSTLGVHFIDQNFDAQAGGATSAAPFRFRQGRADDGQIVGVLADFVGRQSKTPGLRFTAVCSQPRAAAQSMQMQVPDPATTTGAR